jgi:GNAT superfamily N-acetyltransferase
MLLEIDSNSKRGDAQTADVNLEIMTETRLATAADAEAIGLQRQQMFADAGLANAQEMEPMLARFIPWVREKIGDGSYVGWLVYDDGRLVAGAGMWVMEFPPHWMDPEPRRAYLLNFYVAPEMRGHGLARALLALAVDEAKARGIRVVSLHASKFGKPIYERNGFAPSTEMLLRQEP